MDKYIQEQLQARASQKHEKHAREIVDAIIFGNPKLHSLSRSACGFCGAMVAEKDMQDHFEMLHADMADNGAYDYEDRALSEREEYQTAN